MEKLMWQDQKQRRCGSARHGGKHIFLLMLWLFALTGFGSEAVAQVVFRSAASAGVQTGSISYVGSGSQSSSNGGNVTPPLPAGIQTGDLLLCLVESHDNVSHSTTSSGWTALYNIIPSSVHSASLFWKIAASASEANPAIVHASGNGIIANCSAFRGVNTSTPFDVAYNASATANSAVDFTVESGSLTTVTNSAWVLFANHIGNNPDSLSVTTTGGISWSQAFYSMSGLSLDEAVGLFYSPPLPVGSIGPLVATMNNNSGPSTGVLLALRPAISAGTSITINAPSGTTAGDVLVASVAVSPSTIGVTPPSGWSLVRQVVQSAANSSSLQTYYKVAGTGEPANYAWTFSGGVHAGAAGGIAAFSGADPNFPIDAEDGNATASSLSHTAPTLTTTQANSMLVTIHEYASSSTWMPPSGMTEAVDIAALAVPNASGISIEMNYEARPATGTTGTRQATAGANADSGASQSLILKPIGGMTCFNDSFTGPNGPPSSDWSVGNQGGSFGNPKIVSNRLRLTDASSSVATYATLQRLFPAAGNKIVVEFLDYSYGGSAADGIGVVLSDAAQAPVAGAYGGSMGYAPKRVDQGGDTTHPGFAGGWLGIALDEFGNFSANTEGRTGGSAPGMKPDSVSIRGSGSGYTGYPYLQGTGTLSPGIDNAASSSAAPGYKYRIIVDRSSGVNAWTSVERDILNGSGYTYLIPPFDSASSSGQAAVPANWILSFTGSTGGQANIHEIANLQVCSSTQQALSLHHIELDHGGSACGSDTVTVKACADANCTALYGGSVTVSLSYSGASGSPSNPVTFTGGQTVVTLTKSSTGSVTLGTSAISPATANPTRCFSGSVETCTLTFLNACFDAVEVGQARSTPIYTKLAGSAFSLDVLALAGTAINAAYTGTVNVDLVDPTAASGNCTDIQPGLIDTPISTYVFTSSSWGGSGPGGGGSSGKDNGRHTFSFNYPNAARNVKVRIYDTSVNQPVCSSDNFAIRPSQLTLAVAPTFVTLAAGTDFTLTANAGVTKVYNGTPVIDAAQVEDHALNKVTVGAATGVDLTGSFNAGTGSNAAGIFQYNDVGDFTLKTNAVIDSGFTAVDQQSGVVDGVNHGTSGDCVAGSVVNAIASGKFGCNIGSASLGPIGRFFPHHYEVKATFTAACNGFTYMGQDALGLYLDVRAMSANGSTTSRLIPTYSPLPDLTVSGDNGGTLVALSRLSNPSFPSAQWNNGAFTVGPDTFMFTRASPDGPFDQFALKTSVTNAQGAKITSLNNVPITATDTVLSGTTNIRYGRMRLNNAFGSELLPLPMSFIAQYFQSGVGWLTNALDNNCTTIAVPASGSGLSFGAVSASNKLTAGTVSAHLQNATGLDVATGNGVLLNGDSRLRLTSPTNVNAGPGATKFGYVNVTPVVPPYLQFNWTGSGDSNPTGRATFGVYRGGPLIYIREMY